MYARKFEFVDRTDAVWVFEASFAVPTVLVEMAEPAAEEVLLKDIFLGETVNDVAIEPPYPLIDSL
jgi:hypothetical protein